MKLICFDCDSTLSSIEGIDELARLRGAPTLERVEAMTRDAMEGRIAIGEIFARRLEIIRPRLADVKAVGELYVQTVEPSARDTIQALAKAGWKAVILSGGFRQAIAPLAAYLGIEQVEAVDLFFTATGDYVGFDQAFPTTRNGGKRLAVDRLKAQWGASKTVMVGDGVSDLEAAPSVDLFVGFGGYVSREKVRREAGRFVSRLGDLTSIVGAL